MRAASDEMKWNLNFGSIALMWRGGCIIRSRFLNDIKKAYDRNGQIESVLLDPFFKQEILRAESDFRNMVPLLLPSGGSRSLA